MFLIFCTQRYAQWSMKSEEADRSSCELTKPRITLTDNCRILLPDRVNERLAPQNGTRQPLWNKNATRKEKYVTRRPPLSVPSDIQRKPPPPVGGELKFLSHYSAQQIQSGCIGLQRPATVP
ncbi:uncharacterized protein SPSK_01306 [Sporothrix schenckii 1099-18]|uniref:Uncharacterized protein n=1 Tax=Sporothrix schenckii 1099-18 TaxID=1397361 RepID=A0A0F2LVI2_SPOSC|nr:uncharacterized protein SPSK_01306 [Sporothrix schenckii 1099-18]KJR81462.1 hypothetical protein SPSK_01306 [Sporothrix schenckii 1099-18]